MPQKFSDNGRALLSSGIDAAATSLTVEASKADRFASGNTFNWASPVDWFKVVLIDGAGNREVVRVGTRSLGSAVMGNILRAQDGTVARSFTPGTAVIAAFMAQDVTDMMALVANNIASQSGVNLAQDTAIAAKAAGGDFVKFTSSGTFVVPAGRTTIYVSGCAGGGGGGKGLDGAAGLYAGAGGAGGGAGQSAIRVAISVVPGQSHSVTIGAGGIGGFGGVGAQPGANGSATSLGTLLNLLGGTAGNTGQSFGGAFVGGGYCNDGYPPGQSGGLKAGGQGGSSPFGGGGPGGPDYGSYAGPGGRPGGVFGGGGGGGAGGSTLEAAGSSGGQGSPGILIIEW